MAQMTKHQQQAQIKQQNWFKPLIAQAEMAAALDVNWLQQIRSVAKNKIETATVLNRQLENWRYSRVETLFKNNFDADYGNAFDINKLDIKDYLIASLDSFRLVFVNGRYVASLSDSAELPEGVTLGSLNVALKLSVTNSVNKSDNKPADKPIDKQVDGLQKNFSQQNPDSESVFNALNTLLFNDGVYLHIKNNVQLERPIEIIYLNSNQSLLESNDGSMIQTRNIISLEPSASAVLIERFLHLDDSANVNQAADNKKYFFTNVSEINLADNARLVHYRLQDESREAHHLSCLSVKQQQSSAYNAVNLAFGGSWARTEYKVDFKAENAQCELSGLYAVGDGQLVDFHLDVLHHVPSCQSTEKFKGIIYGQGRAVFDGRILVDKQAQHTEAALTNDNLLLVNNAEINTKPQLEIYADDVKCSHGTTVGRLDKQQLFYMSSRGFSEAQAKKLLCQGFAADIIDQISQQELREHVTNRLLSTLSSDDIS